ncbi:uncharacterized protein C8Q71DRAFT_752306 [Rhodofomes roseus]|uniref:Cytoplasmic tRNA 2-thiolation protein 2 n=1 Tax=Rhodofomes roseus TaxID=34475 RepID=A0ABQ8KL22_9APHY|nr:uncharacterized protein C8Q71DRAFT_752306 [Rhodofomes roseus]KAH9838649.1 hypothetical protein C8Q71DRAFT_752306 [Rhodofomes roseus]
MSCGNPAVEGDALMPRRKKYDKTKFCVKCKEAQGSIVIRHAVYCKDCFSPLITHKFRRGLEPSVNQKADGPRRTALKPDGNLLVGFSGGLGSTVLLDLVHRCYVSMDQSTMPSDGGKNHPRHEKVWNRVTVCYVEISGAFPAMRDRTPDVEQYVATYEGLDFVSLRLQDAFDPNWWNAVHASSDDQRFAADMTSEELRLSKLASTSTSTPLQSLHSYLASLPTATAVPTAIETLVRVLLLHTALQTDSSHLVLGTSLTSLAVSLISGVSQGRGYNLKEEMQEEWMPDAEVANLRSEQEQTSHDTKERRSARDGRRKGYVRVVRPLRDVGRKECALWARWRDVTIIGKEPWPWSGAKQGIGALTREFITGLEKDYPSTVSTIVRTCTKVEPKGESAGLCALCARPMQEGLQEWKSRISIRSRDASHDTPPSASASLTPHLCYACHITLTSRSSRPAPSLGLTPPALSDVPLPVWVGSGMPRSAKLSEQQMKEVVQDFLLEDT